MAMKQQFLIQLKRLYRSKTNLGHFLVSLGKASLLMLVSMWLFRNVVIDITTPSDWPVSWQNLPRDQRVFLQMMTWTPLP